jgi:DNA modification methylase
MGLRIAGGTDATNAQTIDGVRLPTEILLRNVADLLPYAKNSRDHSPAQVEALARSMRAVGFTNPLLIADEGILAGHGRLLAAKKLGLTRVPCIDLSHLSADERRALVIWDNRSAELGSTWDLEMLKVETDYLRDVGFDLEATVGFSEEELADMLKGLDIPDEGGEGADPDDAPPAPEVALSEPGDVWVLGNHRVMCGSATEARDWDRLMKGEMAQAVWTDPPFNVDIGAKNEALDKADGGKRAKSGKLQNDKMSDADFRAFLLSVFTLLIEQMEPGSPIYVAHPDLESVNFQSAFREAGFKQQGLVVWNKNNFVLGRFDHQCRTENLVYGWRPGAAHKWYGGRKVSNVIDLGDDQPFTQMPDGRWQVKVGDDVLVINGPVTIERHPSNIIHEPKPAKSELHPTMKPTNLIARQLRNSARRGDIVVDAFGGSGSTAIAAEMLGMKSRLMELSPRYCDVIIRRLQAFTGLRAAHETTGLPFPGEGEGRPEAMKADESKPEQDGSDVF